MSDKVQLNIPNTELVQYLIWVVHEHARLVERDLPTNISDAYKDIIKIVKELVKDSERLDALEKMSKDDRVNTVPRTGWIDNVVYENIPTLYYSFPKYLLKYSALDDKSYSIREAIDKLKE